MWTHQKRLEAIAKRHRLTDAVRLSCGMGTREQEAIALCLKHIKQGLVEPRSERASAFDRRRKAVPGWRTRVARRKHGVSYREYLDWFPLCLAAYHNRLHDLL